MKDVLCVIGFLALIFLFIFVIWSIVDWVIGIKDRFDRLTANFKYLNESRSFDHDSILKYSGKIRQLEAIATKHDQFKNLIDNRVTVLEKRGKTK